ncbi:hypothetical protein PCANC_07194 [Puccinia coronata f. sp. avenae]|uniref:Uncharacterized protein n=1 Tax=Puccinia coronata f. sp. avenae TaxID=200324 RepID=A0A2N5TF31_9BASI|nr:hypothetical protein PCANC_27325 [Puccinia coronata f. sp. avenae]PLW24049.1 hypothetical protein PCASD_14511 [Puccinia coronata f. sp. avenae]PLW50300.1 hypothetical protein PCASD_01662 [Puccinia coronata f. sp. avenae]PLW53515.1 hypothetical protein PCANC_07194 [Puccinia coronata f. sp. avenae]
MECCSVQAIARVDDGLVSSNPVVPGGKTRKPRVTIIERVFIAGVQAIQRWSDCLLGFQFTLIHCSNKRASSRKNWTPISTDASF